MRKADNLQPSCAVVTKSGSLNFLEPSGPVQACNGTALLFFSFFVALRPNAGHGLLNRDVSRSHTVGRTPLDE